MGDDQVFLDHVEGGVAQGLLESVDIGMIAQVLGGKGVPEVVGRVDRHPGANADPTQQVAQVVAVHGAVVAG